jgi:hypothetical protein
MAFYVVKNDHRCQNEKVFFLQFFNFNLTCFARTAVDAAANYTLA